MTRNKREWWPTLEQRFQLAHTLASSVLEFHSISLLQKSISSFKIAFFHSSNKSIESWLKGIGSPFFLRFLHSRIDDAETFTMGPTEDAHHRDYQHPSYLGKIGASYRTEYDHYSLGLVLLEIGLWRSLDDIVRALDDPNKRSNLSTGSSISQPDRILQAVPSLRLYMGSRYQHIVEACLRGNFKIPDDLDEQSRNLKLHRNFSSLIVEPLQDLASTTSVCT